MTPFKNLIGGEWTASHTGATFETRNPADTDEVVGVFQKSDADDARQAIEAARAAQPAWAAVPAPKRGEILHRAAAILESRADQVAREMTREEGKTLPEARGEVGRAINILRYVGGEGARLGGELAPSERDRVFIQTRRRPLGVVGLITPVELSHRDSDVEDRAGAHLRQRRRAQALRPGAAVRGAAGRGAARSRRHQGRHQPGHRAGIEGRQRAGHQPGGEGHLVHGIRGHRQRHCG